MACELTAGFALDCKDGIGGIKAIYLQQVADFATGVTVDGTTAEVDGLPTASIYKYVLPKNTGSFVEDVNSDTTAGTIFYTQTVNATFFKLTAARRKQLELLAKNRLAVFVQDNNDNIWFLDYKDGAEVTALSSQTGTVKGDLNGTTLTLTAEGAVKAYRLESFSTTPFDNFVGITVVAPTI